METKLLIKDFNNLVSHNYQNADKLNEEILTKLDSYTGENINELLTHLSKNNISILNDSNVTEEFMVVLNNISNNAPYKDNVLKMSSLIYNLFKSSPINLSYRQHVNDIFSLMLSTILEDVTPNEYVYELLFEKLLVNRLSSTDTIEDLINNDLNKYIQHEKIPLVKDNIRKLLLLEELNSVDDVRLHINGLQSILAGNINSNLESTNLSRKEDEIEELEEDLYIDKQAISCFKSSDYIEKIRTLTKDDFENWNKDTLDKLQSLIDLVNDTEYLQCLHKIYEVASRYILGIFMDKEDNYKNKDKNMSYKAKKKVILNEFAENEKETVEEELEGIEETDADVEADDEFSAEELKEENLSLKKKVAHLSKQLIRRNSVVKKRSTRNLNSNSITIDDHEDGILDEIKEVTPELPNEVATEELQGDVKKIAIELSNLRKLVLSLTSKTEKAINLASRERLINNACVLLSEVTEELDDTAESLDGVAEELEGVVDSLDTEQYEGNDDYQGEEEVTEVNNSRRRGLRRDLSYRSDRVNLSTTKSSKGKSALDLLLGQ